MSILRNYIPWHRRTRVVWYPFFGYEEHVSRNLAGWAEGRRSSMDKTMRRIGRIRQKKAGQLSLFD